MNIKDIFDSYKKYKNDKEKEKEKINKDHLARINTLNNGITQAFHDYNLIYTTDIEITKQKLYDRASMLYYGHNNLSDSDQKNTMIQISKMMMKFSNDRAKGLPTLAFNLNKLVQDYFNGRSKRYKVRCTIKQFMNNEEDEDKFEVFNVLTPDENSKLYHDENSAFKYIFDRVNHHADVSYISNDIISETAQGLYYNKRIDKNCTEKYWEEHEKDDHIIKHLWRKSINKLNKLSGMEIEHINLKWFHCWSGYNNLVPHIDDCYQSTLVLPITMKTSLITAELRMSLNIKPETNVLILGFLCVDHPEKGFFKDDDDTSAMKNIIKDLSTVFYSAMKVQFDQQYISAEQIQKAVANKKFDEYIRTIDDESMGISVIPIEAIENEPIKKITENVVGSNGKGKKNEDRR